MAVNLTNILGQPIRSQQDPIHQVVVDPPIPPIQCTVTVVDERPIGLNNGTVPTNENPFALTDAEFDELLKGLEESGDEFLRDFEESGIPVHCDIDTELNAVLNMCVEDYVV